MKKIKGTIQIYESDSFLDYREPGLIGWIKEVYLDWKLRRLWKSMIVEIPKSKTRRVSGFTTNSQVERN